MDFDKRKIELKKLIIKDLENDKINLVNKNLKRLELLEKNRKNIRIMVTKNKIEDLELSIKNLKNKKELTKLEKSSLLQQEGLVEDLKKEL